MINILTSIFFGTIMSIIIFYLCIREKNTYRGPNSKDIKSKIFRVTNKDTNEKTCYVFDPKIYLCV